ncbi:MAG: DNA mismatch repair endonuclease MutL [Pseudoflavonifractor sp.]|nr:DNA mismatch repair endonuclease MutL [Alloprevotella sp.]MCM1116247.1 DNA mismatch repair endonuclease MutL [Pseudoflavonifractor sp.]
MTEDIIRLLPDSVANQIAAGEVIQRPASVVKELVENAVDAGATTIDIILRDAGRTLIQVVDNGRGMSDTDARMAFERHATSKITSAADLFTLHTMGFRGEALASIAAVAQVDLRTMPEGASVGTRLIISGSKVESQEPEGCARGTNMMVKNLFFNVPARRKFLKKDSVELNQALREFERLALVNPSVDLSITHNDTLLHKLIHAPLKRRIADLFGNALEQQLIPVETDTSVVRLSGFIGLPAHARKRSPLQYLFVNGRNMRHPLFHKAIMACYEGILAADAQPNYFISFDVDPETIDVNIHPTKNEIKFENEGAIFQILSAAVRESLGRFNAGQGIDFDMTDAPEIPVFSPDAQAGHEVELDPGYNPFASPAPEPASFSPTPSPTMGGGGLSRRTSSIDTTDWEKLYADFAQRRDAPPTPDESQAGRVHVASRLDLSSPDELSEAPAARSASYLQLEGRYILSAARSGLMVVDQHRAHIRILYDRLMECGAAADLSGQGVMFAEAIELSPAQSATLKAVEAELRGLGFDPTFLGGSSWSLNALPAILPPGRAADTLRRILDDTAADTGVDCAETLRHTAVMAIARSSAIPSGRSLSQAEMEELMTSLLRLPAPDYTPDGLPVIAIVPTADITRPLRFFAQ